MFGNRLPTVEEIKALEKIYLNRRIVMIEMPHDPCPIHPGVKGTVEAVDAAGQLIVAWDDGRSLSLIPGVDKFKRIFEEVTHD